MGHGDGKPDFVKDSYILCHQRSDGPYQGAVISIPESVYFPGLSPDQQNPFPKAFALRHFSVILSRRPACGPKEYPTVQLCYN